MNNNSDNLKCKCECCELGREYNSIADFDKMKEFARKVMNILACEQFDLDYHRCILDGSWPNAVEILEKSLAKARLNLDNDTGNGV